MIVETRVCWMLWRVIDTDDDALVIKRLHFDYNRMIDR